MSKTAAVTGVANPVRCALRSVRADKRRCPGAGRLQRAKCRGQYLQETLALA